MFLKRCLDIPIQICWANLAAGPLKPLKAFTEQQRLKSLITTCKEHEPSCSSKRFQELPCDPNQRAMRPKQPAPKELPPGKRFIIYKRPKICCGNPCPDAFPRFDQLYYKRTDKLHRDYQQTWSECPELIKRPKTCCLENIKHPVFKKRPPKTRVDTACKQPCIKQVPKCRRTILKFCRLSRYPPGCKYMRPALNCKKRCPPYPAFSECSHKAPKKRFPVECRCLLRPSMCEVWRYHHFLARVKKIRTC